MKNKILLVGGSGYIGRHLLSELKDKYDVYCTNRHSTNGKPFLIDFRVPATFDNIRSERFDLVIILAATMSGLGIIDLSDHLYINTVGYASFLQSLQCVTDKIIYISSMTVYGMRNKYPVKESGKINPISTYGLSKLMAENITEFYCKRNCKDGVSLRLPGVYGGDRKSGFIYNITQKCKKNQDIFIDTAGLGYWERIDVKVLCAIIKRFIEKYSWEKRYDVFNIGNEEFEDIVKVAFKIKEELNSDSNITFSPKGYVDLYMDNSKIKKIIN